MEFVAVYGILSIAFCLAARSDWFLMTLQGSSEPVENLVSHRAQRSHQKKEKKDKKKTKSNYELYLIMSVVYTSFYTIER